MSDGMMEWIRVDDRPFPLDGSWFLCYREDYILPVVVQWLECKEWEGGYLMNDNMYYFHPRYCSHWMPLPSPPKK